MPKAILLTYEQVVALAFENQRRFNKHGIALRRLEQNILATMTLKQRRWQYALQNEHRQHTIEPRRCSGVHRPRAFNHRNKLVILGNSTSLAGSVARPSQRGKYPNYSWRAATFD